MLDILAAECVKATFFLVGDMANRFPSLVRRTFDDGHTIATHTQTHSPKIWTWPIANQEADISEGIASVGKALGDPRALSPFFRFPGLGKSAEIEAHLAAQGIMVWSADFPADDWTRISAKQVMARAIDRLERKARVLLLHDIKKVTVERAARVLMELEAALHGRARGRAGPDQPKTVTDPQQWVLQTPVGPCARQAECSCRENDGRSAVVTAFSNERLSGSVPCLKRLETSGRLVQAWATPARS